MLTTYDSMFRQGILGQHFAKENTCGYPKYAYNEFFFKCRSFKIERKCSRCAATFICRNIYHNFYDYTTYICSLLSVVIIYTNSVFNFTKLITKFKFYYYKNYYYYRFLQNAEKSNESQYYCQPCNMVFVLPMLSDFLLIIIIIYRKGQ